MTGSWDVPRLNNVEVWNTRNLQYGFLPGVGFLLGKNDLIRMTDCFVHGMHCGFQFEDEFEGSRIKGGTWGVMNGCSTDFCTIGMLFHGRHTMSVSGGKVVIGSNHIESQGSGVVVEPGVRSAVITGNLIETVIGHPAIVNRCGTNSTVIIESNAVTTIPKEPVPKAAN